ncbi:hypothetical protein Bca4012_023378 [Brassica carinata]
MSSSSSSSATYRRRTTHGVPKACWCGKSLNTLVSLTKENPYRRFYRCEIALQRPNEAHLFKWEDEAFLDEIRMVDARRMDLRYDVQAMSKSMKELIEKLQISSDQRDADMRTMMNDHMALLNEELRLCQNESAMKMKEMVDVAIDSKLIGLAPEDKRNGYNIAVAVGVLGALAWFYVKLVY